MLSCDDTDLPAYPQAYYKAKLIRVGEARVFNPGGEVTDYFEKRDFILADTAFFRGMASYVIMNSGKPTDTIWFTNADHVVARLNGSSAKPNYTVTRDSSNFILTGDPRVGVTYGNNLTNHISYFLAKIKPDVYNETLTSSTAGGYWFTYRAREKIVLRAEHGFVLPYIVYTYRPMGDLTSYVYTAGFINNYLNEDFYKNLKGNETVVVSEYWARLEKTK